MQAAQEPPGAEVSMMSQSLLLAAAGAACITVLAALWRSGKFLRALLFSTVTGNLALFGVAYLGAFTGVTIAPGPISVSIATVLGIPGVILMLALRLIFRA